MIWWGWSRTWVPQNNPGWSNLGIFDCQKLQSAKIIKLGVYFEMYLHWLRRSTHDELIHFSIPTVHFVLFCYFPTNLFDSGAERPEAWEPLLFLARRKEKGWCRVTDFFVHVLSYPSSKKFHPVIWLSIPITILQIPRKSFDFRQNLLFSRRSVSIACWRFDSECQSSMNWAIELKKLASFWSVSCLTRRFKTLWQTDNLYLSTIKKLKLN